MTAARAPDTLLGFEQEYRLHRGGQPVDFRELIHRLPIPGRRLDPGDAHAYRLRSGLALTCDDAEAEVATPPLALRPGIAREVEAWAAAGEGELGRLLPAGIAAEGFSTHLSASLPDEAALPALDLFGRAFAPAAVLLFEGAGSRGVYVRPRPGRLEVCGDPAMGSDLAAAAVFFAGAVRACAAAIAGDAAAIERLPPRLKVGLLPASGRYGVYVGRRRAFGFDMVAAGRQSRWPLAGGGWVTAQDHVDLAWRAARSGLVEWVGPEDLARVEAVVAGRRPQRALPPTLRAQGRHSAGAVVDPIRRPGFSAEATIATWDFTVFRLLGRRQAFACVPRDALPEFLRGLGDGLRDAAITEYLATEPTGRRLARPEQTRAADLWDEVAPSDQLLPPERDADGSLMVTDARSEVAGRAGKPAVAMAGRRGKSPLVTTARPGKVPPARGRAESAPPLAPAPRPAGPPTPPPLAPEPVPPRPSGYALWPVSVVAAMAAVLIGTAALAWSHFGGGPSPTETPTASPMPTLTARPTETELATRTRRPTSTATSTSIIPANVTLPTATRRPLATATAPATTAPSASVPPTGEPSPTPTARTPEPTAAPATSPPPTLEPPPTETRSPDPTRVDPTSTDAPAPTAAEPDTPAPTPPRVTAVP